MSKNGTHTNGVNGVEKVEDAPKVFATLDEALANPRHGVDKEGNKKEWSVFRCESPTGEEYFTWSGGGGVALTQVVQSVGWSVGLATSKRGKMDIKAVLAAMDPAQRDEILAQFKKTKKVKAAKVEEPSAN